MNLYYLKEININTINFTKLIDKLKKKLLFSEITNAELITSDGIIYLNDNNYYKKKINYNNHSAIIHKFLKKYTLYKQSNKFIYSKELVYNIPIKHQLLNIKKLKFFNSNNAKTYIILEFCNDKIIDLYFSSDKSELNHSFKEDISYFINLIL